MCDVLLILLGGNEDTWVTLDDKVMLVKGLFSTQKGLFIQSIFIGILDDWNP
jgi:hypothetical protein